MWEWYFFSFGISSKKFWDEPVHHKQLISSVWKLMNNPVYTVLQVQPNIKYSWLIAEILDETGSSTHWGLSRYTRRQNVLSRWPVYEVKCLLPVGGNEGERVATPTSISIIHSYDMKALWFKFGHDIFTGFKMPRF